MTVNPKESLSEVVLVATYDATDLFAQEESGISSPDWDWCMEHAAFSHREACEFMVYCGDDTETFKRRLGDMGRQGATQKLINHVKHARGLGAKWAMFYA